MTVLLPFLVQCQRPPTRSLFPTDGTRVGDPDDLGDFFNQLDLDGEEFDDLEIDIDDPELNNSVRWLALARVHTEKSFIQSAFYK